MAGVLGEVLGSRQRRGCRQAGLQEVEQRQQVAAAAAAAAAQANGNPGALHVRRMHQ